MKRAALALVLIVSLLAAAGCAPATDGTGEGGGSHGIVPDVIGMTEAEAGAALEEAGYVVGDVTTAESAYSDPGTVVSQDPIASSSVAAESEVDLVIAAP
ncbi:MAG TPA: PASTA domain-containing protein [Coriobacteriia bacterium]|nr:PASTA domain-containing protein [Coriobacteriia bacterium]